MPVTSLSRLAAAGPLRRGLSGRCARLAADPFVRLEGRRSIEVRLVSGIYFERNQAVAPDHIALLGRAVDQPNAEHAAAIVDTKPGRIVEASKNGCVGRALLCMGRLLRLVPIGRVPCRCSRRVSRAS
jgi:hypothetical protein